MIHRQSRFILQQPDFDLSQSASTLSLLLFPVTPHTYKGGDISYTETTTR